MTIPDLRTPKTIEARPLAVLVGVQLPGVSDAEHASDLAELGRLVQTLGYTAVATLSQKRRSISSGIVLGTGKLRELAALTGGSGVVTSGASEKKSKARQKWEAAESGSADEDGEERDGVSASDDDDRDDDREADDYDDDEVEDEDEREASAVEASDEVDDTDGALGDRVASDRAAGDGAAGDRAAGDRAAGDRAAGDVAAYDRAAGDRAAGDVAAYDRAANDRNADTRDADVDRGAARDSDARDSDARHRDANHRAANDDRDAESNEQGPLPAGEKIAVVVVNHDLSPSQLSNLERATGVGVIDRSGVIVDIFHRHARSREARMQVEIARLNYLSPRMRVSTGSRERQQGRGSGDSAIELDRRRIRDRLAELREGLAAIQADHDQRRYARRDQLRVALVGYTNAGKSSLMRALTGSEVLVADKLFATLDTTVRALHPESRPRILVSDTVGFIQKLPHDLVASFRSTLDEALEASLLLYVVDASDPSCEAQLEVTHQVLAEIGAREIPSRLVFNKSDRLTEEARAAILERHPGSLMLSAHSPEDVSALRATLIDFFDSSMVEAELMIPYARQGRISEVYENARVVSEAYDEVGRRLRVRALPAAIAKLTQTFPA